jgi:hypothetical protein
LTKWKTKNDPDQAGFGKHYPQSQPMLGIRTYPSGVDLPAQPRSVDSMKTPQVTGPELIQKSSYTGEPLTFHSFIGQRGTALYIGKDVTNMEIEDLSDSFERLPPTAQAEISKLEVYSTPGKRRTVGIYEFTEGGHWSENDKVIRVFRTTEGSRWIGFETTDDVISHEAGHALWDRLQTRSYHDEPYPSALASKIFEHARAQRRLEINKIHARYEPQLQTLYADYQRKLNESLGFWGSTEEMIKKNAEWRKAERKMRDLGKKRDAEIEEAQKKWDPNPALELLLEQKQPISRSLNNFRDASHEEGGITSYSYAWEKDPNFGTENFAECMKIFYSGSVSLQDAEKKRKAYPKTYAAFRKLIQPEVMGHAVSLKHKPKRGLIKNA